MKKIKGSIINGTYMYNVATKQRRDINAAKLEGIISKLDEIFENGFLQRITTI